MELCSRSITFDKKFTLIPIGDVHLGARACHEKKLDQLIKWVLDRPDTYVLGMGDDMDMILPQDRKRFKTSAIDPKFLPHMDNIVGFQLDYTTEKFRPLAEAGRLLGKLEGNHEESIEKHHGFNVTKELCKRLGVPYLGYSCFYRLTLRKGKDLSAYNIMIYAHHGHGGGKKMGASVNTLQDAISMYDADIYLMGHNHKKHGNRFIRLEMSGKGEGKLKHKPKIAARTGTFLKTAIQGDTTYSEKAGYPPTDIGVVRIDITLDRISENNKVLDIHVSE